MSLSNLAESALDYLRAGLSVIATGADKLPCVGGSWEAVPGGARPRG